MANTDSAIIIKDLWGKILTSVVVAGILGGISFAFAQAGTNAEIQTNVQNITSNSKERDTRIDKMDGKIDTMTTQMGTMQQQQATINTKLDILLQRDSLKDMKPSR